jgi:hypothetical protein
LWCVGRTSGGVLIGLATFACPVPGLATAVAVAYAASPVTALGPCVCEGFIGTSFFFLLPLPSLTACVPVFQVLRLLNDTVNKGVGVEDECHSLAAMTVAVASRVPGWTWVMGIFSLSDCQLFRSTMTSYLAMYSPSTN